VLSEVTVLLKSVRLAKFPCSHFFFFEMFWNIETTRIIVAHITSDILHPQIVLLGLICSEWSCNCKSVPNNVVAVRSAYLLLCEAVSEPVRLVTSIDRV